MNSLEEYILAHIDAEDPQLAALNRRAHVELLRPRMIAGLLQGQLLKMLVRMTHSHRILEIGTYTAYATLCMAAGLPDTGEIHTIEKDDEMEDFIRREIALSGLQDHIRLYIGDAMQVIPTLSGAFDLVYIDADKRHYCDYYDLVFDKVPSGGVILADNTLWNGKVIDETVPPSDKQTLGILQFNEKIKQDKRVEKVILPLRDGLTIIYKK